jgi:hypothetical protein
VDTTYRIRALTDINEAAGAFLPCPTKFPDVDPLDDHAQAGRSGRHTTQPDRPETASWACLLLNDKKAFYPRGTIEPCKIRSALAGEIVTDRLSTVLIRPRI